ncbi:hypothetical protein ACFPIJ_41255 [Dactylosporangium cerinum]|uniref:Uncharacterized protein n=1 Tax=Dactylosporangium cerinum TaxID=1434730 RepID=A0ABV9W6C5_9ACTN
MTHQLFDELIGTPPPSTVDVDGIVRRRTGLRWLRRAALSGSAAAVVGAVALLPAGGAPVAGPSTDPAIDFSAGPSGRGSDPPDINRFFDDSMRSLLPQRVRWLDLPPQIVLPPDGGAATSARSRVDVAGRQGTVVVTVWPHGVDAATGCAGLQSCTIMTDPSGGISCGRVDDVAVRPELGLTRPGWEVRCVKPGGRPVSILVTNQTGAPTEPPHQPELPIQLSQVIPIISVLAGHVG